MAKRKMSENSLKNLEKRKSFSKDDVEFALNAQQKSVEKRKENQTMREAAERKLNKLYNDGLTFQEKSMNLIEEYVLTGICKPDDLVKLLTFLRDTAGQKPKDVVENVAPPIINIEGIKI